MMLSRLVLAGVAAAVLTAATGAAEAGDRKWRLRFFEPHYYTYYPGPRYIPEPEYRFYSFRSRDRYYDYEDDEDFYEPELDVYDDEPIYEKPRRKKVVVRQEERVAPVQKRKTASVKKPVEPAKKKSAVMSCDKATGIVSGYGFQNVKATDCKGDAYAFNAQRGGKPYVITLNAANGELTGVKKVQ
jgi:hypothetical protein